MSRNFSAIIGFVLLCLVIYLWIALTHNVPEDSALGWRFPVNAQPDNSGGRFGAQISEYLLTYIGWGSYFCLASVFAFAILIFEQRSLDHALVRSVGWWVTLIGLMFFFSLTMRAGFCSLPYGPGGFFGEMIYQSLIGLFAFTGCLIISLSMIVSGGLMFAESAIFQLFHTFFYRPMVRIYRVWFRAKWFRTPTPVSSETPSPSLGTALSSAGSVVPAMDGGFSSTEPGLSHETADSFDLPATGTILTAALPVSGRQDGALSSGGSGVSQETSPDGKSSEKSGASWSLFGWGKKKTPKEADDSFNDDDSSNGGDSSGTGVRRGVGGKVGNRKSSGETESLDLKETFEIVSPYELPSVELLDQAEKFDTSAYEAEIEENSRLLETTCCDFGINVQVVTHQTGPVLTMYEIQRERGTRLNKITSLANDLAVAMKAGGVRVVAPLPNRATIGIEIPNRHKKSVRLREVIEDSRAVSSGMGIPVYLGRDVSGEAMCADLAKLPHLLVAGQTGSGKSVCLHSIIVSMLMTRAPEEVRMIMIDPKMVELSQYKDIPHLMYPVVTDMKKAEAILAWAVNKMEDRYSLLARVGVRNIGNYNQLGHADLLERAQPENEEDAQQIPDRMPYIVIIIDEFADMMMTCPKEVEAHIARLAQKSRAVGIHLILATQKPTRDVITGLIKSNLPARISFQVTCLTDSRVVLDVSGAERLLGAGDMLFLKPGTSMPIRGQGAFLEDREIDRIIRFVKRNGPMYDDIQLPDEEDGGDNSYEKLAARDELYPSAIELIVNEGRGSTSFLQTKLGIGYGRAARLIELMEQDRIVGGHNGGKPREVLLSPEEWEIMKRQQDSPLTSIRGGQPSVKPAPFTPVSASPGETRGYAASPGGASPGETASRNDSPRKDAMDNVPFDDEKLPEEESDEEGLSEEDLSGNGDEDSAENPGDSGARSDSANRTASSRLDSRESKSVSTPAWKKEPTPVDINQVNSVNYSQSRAEVPAEARVAPVRENEKTPKVVADGAGGEYETAATQGRRTPARFVKTIRVDNPSRTPEAASTVVSTVRTTQPVAVSAVSAASPGLVSASASGNTRGRGNERDLETIPFEDVPDEEDDAYSDDRSFSDDYFDDLRDDYALSEEEGEESAGSAANGSRASSGAGASSAEKKITRLRPSSSYSDEESRILDEISRSARAYLKK